MIYNIRKSVCFLSPSHPDLTAEEFFRSSRVGEASRFTLLGQALAEVLQTLPEKVHIFSVGNTGQQSSKGLKVWFAVHGSPYYKAEKLHGYVAANKDKVRRVSFFPTPHFQNA